MTIRELKVRLNNTKENNITYIENKISGCENEWVTCFVENVLKNSIGLDYAVIITGIDITENSIFMELSINGQTLWINITDRFSVECDIECVTWEFGCSGSTDPLSDGYCVIDMYKNVVIDSDR